MRIDPTKINGLAEWREELKDVHEVRSTLGAFGYNRPFIKGYAEIVRPLTKLTKKDEPFVWTDECTQAIRKLKQIVGSDPVLKRPDHDRPFCKAPWGLRLGCEFVHLAECETTWVTTSFALCQEVQWSNDKELRIRHFEIFKRREKTTS